jgi:hypothetical protein
LGRVKPGAAAHYGRGAIRNCTTANLHAVLSTDAPGSAPNSVEEARRAMVNIFVLRSSRDSMKAATLRDEGSPAQKRKYLDRILMIESHLEHEEEIVKRSMTIFNGGRV